MIKKIFLLSLGVFISSFVLANEAQLVIDPVTKKIYVTTGDISTTPIMQEQNTGNSFNFADNYVTATGTTTGEIIVSSGAVNTTPVITIDTTNLSEFEQALARMYTNGLTKYNTTGEYRPSDSVTREEAAKLIGEAYKKLGYPTTVKNQNCSFADADLFDPSLANNIQEVCHRGLFQGSEGKFLPTDTMTKGQALAVLIRMLEGKKSDESMEFWRDIYHKKGLTIGLTKDNRVAAFIDPITREDIAIFIYRTKNIVADEQRKIFSLNAMNQIDGSTGSNHTVSDGEHLASIASGIDISNDPELQEAISWMYENGFTIHQTATNFQPFTLLSKEQAAKIINTFAGLYGGSINLLPEGACHFSDLGDTPEDLIPHIISACRQGLVVGQGDRFNPKQNISKAQFIVALIRLLEGKQLDERTDPRWKNYFELARSIEVVAAGDAITFDNAITRYEVAVFLYRFKVKYLILKNLNNSRLPNEVVSMVSGSIMTGVSGLPEGQVFINTPLLGDSNFTLGYIDTFGIRQKIVRTSTEKFFTNNVVRYGDVYNMETDQKIGTITFIVGNGFLIEGTIRYTDANKDFIITAIPGNQSLYAIKTVPKANQTTQVETNSGSVVTTGTVNTGSTQ